MTRSPLRRLVFGTLRRVLYLWVRSETINQSAFTLKLDRSKPVFYVLQQPSLSDLAVVDTECRKAGLPRPVLPVAVGELLEPAAFFYLTPEPDWLGRQDKRGISPTLQRLVSALSQHAVDDAQIIPVSVFWGQSPDRETSPWKLLFADSWAVTGRLRRLVSILILGRKTRVQFSTPIHLRELVEQDKGHERTLRMVQRILRVHFRNQKAAVIGPDVSHRRNLVKGLVHDPLVRQAIAEEAEREKISAWQLVRTATGLKGAVTQVMLLSLVLEVLAIASPFFLQLVVDRVVVGRDRDLLAVLGLYVVASVVAFLAYGHDKSAAVRNAWRVQERTLHLFALLGGWPGALAAQRLFRHKSSKASFQSTYWITVVLNCAALGWLLSPYGAQTLQTALALV